MARYLRVERHQKPRAMPSYRTTGPAMFKLLPSRGREKNLVLLIGTADCQIDMARRDNIGEDQVDPIQLRRILP